MTQLDDLDFVDDIALLSHNHRQMQEKTDQLDETARSLGLNINKGKSKIMRLKTNNNNAVGVNGESLEDVESFTYLGSTIDKEGGVQEDVKRRIQKARQAFIGLRKIWASRSIQEKTKLKIFNSNVKSVLLYGAETWKANKEITMKLQTFCNGCLRRICGIHWPDTISNTRLLERTGQQPMERELKNRKWRWIGHTLRRPRESITRQGLWWNPQGSRARGRPRNTWRRETEKEMD